MSRDTEKMFKELHEYMAQNAPEDMSEEELDEFVNQFMSNYNSRPQEKMTEKTAKTSDDFLELAQDADNEGSALKYAKRALKLDPSNLDAEFMIADITAKSQVDMLNRLRLIVKHGEQVMQAKGYADENSIGNYWVITETRPYMRVRDAYISLLRDMGMIRAAVAECEDMLRLNENDNQGIRYTLMHLYAILEEEQKALELHKKYDSYEETQMLFPLSIMYFKLGDLDQAGKYLKRLSKANPDTRKFVKAFNEDRIDRYASQMSDFGYRPFTMEELITELMENLVLFQTLPAYFFWAEEQLAGKKRKA